MARPLVAPSYSTDHDQRAARTYISIRPNYGTRHMYLIPFLTFFLKNNRKFNFIFRSPNPYIYLWVLLLGLAVEI
jgi:hypothetical protein